MLVCNVVVGGILIPYNKVVLSLSATECSMCREKKRTHFEYINGRAAKINRLID